ncbi:MAG: DnaJ C-terminal domain-containing protein [Gammaproteobacteria bacterium]
MNFKDYYQILGVERTATQDEVKRAYRRLARKYHPDVSKEADAEERFKEVGEAYEVLKDPEKRAAYDQLGANWQAGQDFEPPPNWDAGFEFNGANVSEDERRAFSEFFESLFGQGFAHGGQPGSGPHSRSGAHASYRAGGEDHHAKVVIDIEDSYNGATREFTLRTPELDPAGRVVNTSRTLSVRIPKGVKQGQKIRLSGQGGSGIGGGAAGDLYLEVEFNPHKLYRVEGRDVYMNVPVTPWEAALGATIKVPTPSKQLDLKIPANTLSGKKLRLKGQGIPSSPPGDIYVTLEIKLPSADTETAKAFYAEMAENLAFNPRAEMGV